MKRLACETPNCKGYQDVIDRNQKICAECYIERRPEIRSASSNSRPLAHSYPQPVFPLRSRERYRVSYDG